MKKGENRKLELDALAYSNTGRNEAFVVEIKSTLSLSAIDQLKETLEKFREFFPEHRDKKLFGIICAIEDQDKIVEEVLNNGFYFARVRDGFFKIVNPKGFKAKEY
jgi:hypothetical protein